MNKIQIIEIIENYKKIREEHEYEIEDDEYKSNVGYGNKIIKDLNEQIKEVMRISREIIKTSRYRLKELEEGKITVEEYIKRAKEDITNIGSTGEWVEERSEEIGIANEMVTIIGEKMVERNERIGEKGVNKCRFGCKGCGMKKPGSSEFFEYCVNGCVWCSKMRKIEKTEEERGATKEYYKENTSNKREIKEVIKEEPIKEMVKEMVTSYLKEMGNVEEEPRREQGLRQEREVRGKHKKNKPTIIDTEDKYYEVTLTATEEDGDSEYIIAALEKNFKQMFPVSYAARAWVYGIERTQKGIPHLHGLIRYRSDNKNRISPKSTHLKNNIVSQYTKEKKGRRFSIENYTTYIDKGYDTRIDKIRERYIYITKEGMVTGDELDKFI